jgi:hypothetical protein
MRDAFAVEGYLPGAFNLSGIRSAGAISRARPSSFRSAMFRTCRKLLWRSHALLETAAPRLIPGLLPHA